MLKGIPVSPGIGIGRAFVFKTELPVWDHSSAADPEAEVTRLRQAVKAFSEKTEALIAASEEAAKDGSQADMLRGHMAMMADPFMLSQMEEKIRAGACAEDACEAVLTMFEDMFSQTDDPLTQQRAADVRDIKGHMLHILTGTEAPSLDQFPEGAVLIAEELTPSMVAEIPAGRLAAAVTEKGGYTAHSAILARTMEIPAVYSVEKALERVEDHDIIVVDGDQGQVLVNPPEEKRQQYEACRRRAAEEKALLTAYKDRDTRMADGQRRQVFCNVGSAEEAHLAADSGGEGIGLFRTEFLFTGRDVMPDEEEQFAAYKEAAEAFDGREVIIRTMDIGGDKQVPYLKMEAEDNPFLGFRAIRYCLAQEDLYRIQLRAILRASAYGRVKLMIPLVTGVEEVRRVRTMVRELMGQLRAEGRAFDENLEIGIMVETPSACQIADLLAGESDFFSIGTNDLIQYTMAADRGNPKVAYLNSPYHPAVLRSIWHIIRCGREAGIPVAMCGEAAADPLMTPLLLAFGLSEFSVAAPAVTRIRAEIGKWSGQAAARTAERAMALATASEVKSFLEDTIKENKEGIYHDEDCN